MSLATPETCERLYQPTSHNQLDVRSCMEHATPCNTSVTIVIPQNVWLCIEGYHTRRLHGEKNYKHGGRCIPS